MDGFFCVLDQVVGVGCLGFFKELGSGLGVCAVVWGIATGVEM